MLVAVVAVVAVLLGAQEDQALVALVEQLALEIPEQQIWAVVVVVLDQQEQIMQVETVVLVW
jgi:hypothetical protein